MCKHLTKPKISFRDYFLKKLKNETIYFYCEKCNSFFIEKRKDEIVNSWIFIYLFIITINFIVEATEIKAYIGVPVSILFLLLLYSLHMFINWKLLTFEELKTGTKTGDGSIL